jgi:hypothetical protein
MAGRNVVVVGAVVVDPEAASTAAAGWVFLASPLLTFHPVCLSPLPKMAQYNR